MEKFELRLDSNELHILRNLLDDFFRKGDDSKLRQMFRSFDRNNNGKVDAVELKSVIEQIQQERMTDDEIGKMMKEADTNENGTIEYSEFCEIMLRQRRALFS